VSRMRRVYGQRPLHLLAVLACFALAGASLVGFVDSGPVRSLVLWFAGAIVAHDLLLFPAYSLLDRLASRSASGSGRDAAARRTRPAVNYVRVPTVVSALLFLVYCPLILGLSSHTYQADTGLQTNVYLGRWLLISGALFALSAAAYVLALLRAARRK
jgi:hypothetical protein